MKPFDLEAAKRGEALAAYWFVPGNDALAFVGVRKNGDVVFECAAGLYSLPQAALFMLPKKIVRYGMVHDDRKGRYIATSLVADPHALGSEIPGYHIARVEWEE